RGGRRQSEVDLDAVALTGADPGALDGEASLVVRGDDVGELLPGEPEAVGGGRRDQGVDLGPATLVEGESDSFRAMPQVSGEVFRHPHSALFVHAFRLPGVTRITRRVSKERFDPQLRVVIHKQK